MLSRKEKKKSKAHDSYYKYYRQKNMQVKSITSAPSLVFSDIVLCGMPREKKIARF